LSQIFV